MPVSAESNDDFANRMRIRRGEKPRQAPRVPALEDTEQVRARIVDSFLGINPEMVTVGNVEARIRAIPGVEDVKVTAKKQDHLDLDVKLTQTLRFIPIVVSLEGT